MSPSTSACSGENFTDYRLATQVCASLPKTHTTLYVSRQKTLAKLHCIDVRWTSDWAINIHDENTGSEKWPILAADEISSVRSTAIDELRSAYAGFRIIFFDDGVGADRRVLVKNEMGPADEIYAHGQTSNVGYESNVFIKSTVLTLNSIKKERQMNLNRREYLEALGRGLGRTAAHELGHQGGQNWGWTMDTGGAAKDTYDYKSGGYDFFFGNLHWSRFALDKMNDLRD